MCRLSLSHIAVLLFATALVDNTAANRLHPPPLRGSREAGGDSDADVPADGHAISYKCIHGDVNGPDRGYPMRIQSSSVSTHAGLHAQSAIAPQMLSIQFLRDPSDSGCTAAGTQAVPLDSTIETKVTCEPYDVQDTQLEDYINELAREAADMLQQSLQVVPEASSVTTVAQETCRGLNRGVKIPSSATGVDATSTMYVVLTYRPLRIRDEEVFAYSTPCQEHHDSGRVLVGHLNIVPAASRAHTAPYTIYGPQNAVRRRNDRDAILHELVHLLGFRTATSANLALFPSRGYATSSNSSEFTVSPYPTFSDTELTYSRMLIRTPRLVVAARNYLGCSTLAGVEREGFDDTSTDVHFESRVYLDDLMTVRQLTTFRYLSEMTLAALEDTGNWVRIGGDTPWQRQAAFQTFGRGRGCDHQDARCNANFSANKPTEHSWCFDTEQDSLAESCSEDRLSRAYCNRESGRNIQTTDFGMRYFGGSRTDGGDRATDYCPVRVPFMDGACIDPTLHQWDKRAGLFLQTYSTESRCFLSNVATWGVRGEAHATRCLRVNCTEGSDGGGYLVLIAVQQYGQQVDVPLRCPAEGGRIYAPNRTYSITGFIDCPPRSVQCHETPTPNVTESAVSENTAFVPLFYSNSSYLTSTGSTTTTGLAGNGTTPCSMRFANCVLPIVDLAWPSGRCGEIARAFAACYGGDCENELRAQRGQRTIFVEGRGTVNLPNYNCSTLTITDECPTEGAEALMDYCSVGTGPSAASARSAAAALATLSLLILLTATFVV